MNVSKQIENTDSSIYKSQHDLSKSLTKAPKIRKKIFLPSSSNSKEILSLLKPDYSLQTLAKKPEPKTNKRLDLAKKLIKKWYRGNSTKLRASQSQKSIPNFNGRCFKARNLGASSPVKNSVSPIKELKRRNLPRRVSCPCEETPNQSKLQKIPLREV